MKKTILSLIIPALILTLAPASSKGQSPNPPGQFSYQGFLTDANGLPLATNNPINYTVIFRIYNKPDNSAGAVQLWAEQQVVTVDRGYFTVLLGNGTSLPGVTNSSDLPSVFAGTNTVPSDASDRYLELTVTDLGSTPIAPRLRLLPSPYAYLAATAVNVSAAGHVPDTSLSTNVALRNASQAFTGVNTFNNAVGISAANTLEFGAGVAGQEPNAGRIGYQTFTTGALDIVGAGTNGTNRKIQFWAEGGANFTGDVKMRGGNNGNTVFASGSIEDLRIVRGIVRNDGSIFNGAGFTVTKNGTGSYTLNFNPVFADVPSVTITPAPNATAPVTATWNNGNYNNVLIETWSGSSHADVWFNFIAIAGR
jgi:hypothetical protein